MKRVFFYLLIILSITSCSSSLDKKYNVLTISKDMEDVKNDLDSNDKKLLAGSIFRLALKGEKLEDKTYREILEDGKKWKIENDAKEAEEKKLADEAKRKEGDRIRLLSEVLTVTVFEKGYTEYEYQEYITYKFVFKNKGQKDISAFTGQLIFTDLFDKEIKKINLTYDDGVKAGQDKTYNASSDYNKFMDEDQLLKSKDLDKMKLIWKPEKILFSDGTKLE